MKKIMLTGASGFIGRHCIPLLVSRGYEIHAITSRNNPPRDFGIKWHTIDLLNPVHVHDLMDSIRPTHLMHFAWYTVPGKYWAARENIQWIQASLNLFSEFIKCGGHRIVGVGTCAEYDWNYGYCSEHVTPLKPTTLYGVSKHSLHMMMEEVLKDSKICAAWGRIFFLYGPYEEPSRMVSSIIRALLQGKPAPCTEGTHIRDYLFVEDVADAFVELLESEVAGPVNIASGKPVYIRHIIELIVEKIGRDDLIQYGKIPYSPSDAPMVVADNRRLLQEVGWQQHYDLSEGLDKTISWWTDVLSKGKNDSR
jgi:nucleoside-diphosphate-sugar epimerase